MNPSDLPALRARGRSTPAKQAARLIRRAAEVLPGTKPPASSAHPTISAWIGQRVMVPYETYRGKKGKDLPVSAWWPAKVLAGRIEYGRLNLLVEPVGGEGRAWVSAARLLEKSVERVGGLPQVVLEMAQAGVSRIDEVVD